MLENQTEVTPEHREETGEPSSGAMPELTEVHEAHTMEVYKDGEVQRKAQAAHGPCRRAGQRLPGMHPLPDQRGPWNWEPPRGEILESCAVAVSLGGTMASSSTARVMEYLIEQGVME